MATDARIYQARWSGATEWAEVSLGFVDATLAAAFATSRASRSLERVTFGLMVTAGSIQFRSITPAIRDSLAGSPSAPHCVGADEPSVADGGLTNADREHHDWTGKTPSYCPLPIQLPASNTK